MGWRLDKLPGSIFLHAFQHASIVPVWAKTFAWPHWRRCTVFVNWPLEWFTHSCWISSFCATDGYAGAPSVKRIVFFPFAFQTTCWLRWQLSIFTWMLTCPTPPQPPPQTGNATRTACSTYHPQRAQRHMNANMPHPTPTPTPNRQRNMHSVFNVTSTACSTSHEC